MEEAKKGVCEKCKQYFYVHEHHILSKSIFGKGKTVKLCPNCHTHFHEYSKKKTKNANDIKEAKRIWNKWLNKVAVVCSIALILTTIIWMA